MLKTVQTLRSKLWSARASTRTGRWGLQTLRAVDALAHVLAEGRLSLWAMSLVYTTLLSLTPFLALGFSLLKALGVHNSLEPVLVEALRGLGPAQARQVADKLVSFVAKVEVGVLGSLGVALLIYSAVSLIQKVEGAFNEVWRVENPRGIASRLTEYLAVLMVGPVIVFSALGLTASAVNGEWAQWLSRFEPFGFLLYSFSALLPYVLIVAAFTFLYAFVPQVRVRWRAALSGGLVAGFLWQTLSYAFAGFVEGATDYNAIYSGFAIVLFVLIWFYVGWLILLAGCQIAYFVQHPERMNPLRPPSLPLGRAREEAGLNLMAEVGLRFLRGAPTANRELLGQQLGLTESGLQSLALPLIAAGYLAESGAALIPARDPASYTLADLWLALRGTGATAEGAAPAALAQWLDAAEAAPKDGPSFRDWLLQIDGSAGEKSDLSQ